MEEENQNIENEKQEIEEKENFIQLLKVLGETQFTLDKIYAQISMRKGQDLAENIYQDTKQDIIDNAKACGVKMKKMETDYDNSKESKGNIEDVYKEALDGINKEYDNNYKNIIAEKMKLENEEQNIMVQQKDNQIKLSKEGKKVNKETKKLKKQASQYIKDGKNEEAKKIVDEIKKIEKNSNLDTLKKNDKEFEKQRADKRKEIENKEKELEDALKERDTKLKDAKTTKNNQLATVPKQKFFSKIIGSLMSKFNGGKKFMKNTIEPIQKKIDSIQNEEIPKLQERFKDMQDKGKSTYRGIIDGAHNALNNKINEKQKELEEQKKKLKELQKDQKENDQKIPIQQNDVGLEI